MRDLIVGEKGLKLDNHNKIKEIHVQHDDIAVGVLDE